MDNKRRLYRLIEAYLNGFKGDLVESIYGNKSRIKVHTVTFGVSDNSVLVELVVILGDVINEETLDTSLAEILIQEALVYFFAEKWQMNTSMGYIFMGIAILTLPHLQVFSGLVNYIALNRKK